MSVIVRLGALENDGVDYEMWLESPHAQPGRAVQSADRYGTWPVVTTVQPGAIVDLLHVVIRPELPKNETLDAPLRSALLRTLDTDRAAVPLVIADNDGSNERYRYYVVRSPDEQEDEVAGLHWVATMVTAGDTKWRSVTPTSVVWNAGATGAQQVVANGGDAPAYPTYELRPTADRTAGWDKRMFVAFDPNIAVVGPEEVPYDIADPGWNTAALVTAGTIASADEIGVIIDGREVRRWLTGYNTTATEVWVNLQSRPSQTAILNNGFGAGDVITELEVLPVAADIRLFPNQGMLLIDSEVFTYTGKDNQRGKFLGVKRAAKDTAAGTHTDYATIRWIEHEIWIVYGGQTAEFDFYDDAPEGVVLDYDDRKPTIDLGASTNTHWQFSQWPYGDTSSTAKYRYPKWRSVESALGTAGLTTLIDPSLYSQMYVERHPGVVDPLVGGTWEEWRSYWLVNLPGYWIEALQAEVSAARYDTGDFIVFIGTAVQRDEALLEFTRPPTINERLYETLEWSGSIDPARLYFAQYGTAAMRANLDSLIIDFSSESYDGPQIVRTTAHDNYSLDLTLANLTTAEAIALRTELAWATDLGLRIDSDTRRVTLIGDGSNQYQALTRDAHRQDVLPLLPGDNTLRVDETGLQGMQVVVTFEKRTYT